MLAGHLIYGTALAMMSEAFRRDARTASRAMPGQNTPGALDSDVDAKAHLAPDHRTRRGNATDHGGQGREPQSLGVDPPSARGGAMFRRLPLVIPIVLFTGALVALSRLDASQRQRRTSVPRSFLPSGGSTVADTAERDHRQPRLGPGSSVTGFPPGTLPRVQHISDAVALQAKNDLSTAYTEAANAPVTTDMTGLNLGGKNLTPGVYKFDTSAQLTGPLDAQRQRHLHLSDR